MPDLVVGNLRILEMTEDETGRVIPLQMFVCQEGTMCPPTIVVVATNSNQQRERLHPGNKWNESERSLGGAC